MVVVVVGGGAAQQRSLKCFSIYKRQKSERTSEAKCNTR